MHGGGVEVGPRGAPTEHFQLRYVYILGVLGTEQTGWQDAGPTTR